MCETSGKQKVVRVYDRVMGVRFKSIPAETHRGGNTSSLFEDLKALVDVLWQL